MRRIALPLAVGFALSACDTQALLTPPDAPARLITVEEGQAPIDLGLLSTDVLKGMSDNGDVLLIREGLSYLRTADGLIPLVGVDGGIFRAAAISSDGRIVGWTGGDSQWDVYNLEAVFEWSGIATVIQNGIATEIPVDPLFGVPVDINSDGLVLIWSGLRSFSAPPSHIPSRA